MNTHLNHYLQDGMNRQAAAVLAMLQYVHGDGIEDSWNATTHRYDAEPRIAPWINGRERGYVVSLASFWFDQQVNIYFAENRNSDQIVIYHDNRNTYGQTPDVATMTAWSTATYFAPGKIAEAADFIFQKLLTFWEGVGREPLA